VTPACEVKPVSIGGSSPGVPYVSDVDDVRHPGRTVHRSVAVRPGRSELRPRGGICVDPVELEGKAAPAIAFSGVSKIKVNNRRLGFSVIRRVG